MSETKPFVRLAHESPRQAQFRRDMEDAGFEVCIYIGDGSTTETYAVKCGPGGPMETDIIGSTKIRLVMDGLGLDIGTMVYVGAAHR